MAESQERIIVGLDIGTTKVCAIVGRANQYGKVDILGMGKVSSHGGVTRGVVSNIDKTVLACLLYTSPSPRDRQKSRMPSSA